MKQQTVLVTGAGGFIGAHLVRRLLSEHIAVHVIWKKETNPWRITDTLPKLSLHEIELTNRVGLTQLLHRVNPQTVFHLAAHGAYSTQTDIDRMVDVNIRGTLNLLLASKDIDYDAFINTGSSSEYGYHVCPMKETDALEPVSFYAATKASATHLCGVFGREFNKPVVTLRPFSVYGPLEEPSRFMPTIMRSLLNQKPIALTVDDARRDFIYIDDVIDAYLVTMRKANAIRGEVVNIGTGKEYTNDEVVQTLFSSVKKKTPVLKGAFPGRPWDTEHWVADRSKAKRVLGWQPRHTLASGLKKTYEWFTRHNHLYDIPT